jgi:hypothetical protein
MPGVRVKPIYSSRGNDPSVSDVVDDFVIGVSERIDQLQDFESEQDFPRIAENAAAFVADARRAGFDELERVANELAAASAAQREKDSHARLVELTELVHRVRLGHKGAA